MVSVRIEHLGAEVSFSVEVDVYPSEDPEKVRICIKKLFQGVEPHYDEASGRILAKSERVEDLYRLYEQLRIRKTLGVARRLLLNNVRDDSTWIYINKQAAYRGLAIICEEEGESPLGPIKLTICSDNILELVDWLAPK